MTGVQTCALPIWTFIIKDFKAGRFDILVSSDITARGIHVEDIDLVVNYEVPRDREVYVHRIGRTGRVEKEGTAITLMSPKEDKYLKEIEAYTGREVEKLDEIEAKEIKEGKIKFENLKKEKKVRKKENRESKESQEVIKVYINVGKKKKIRVIDIVGALSNVKGINNEDIGEIGRASCRERVLRLV